MTPTTPAPDASCPETTPIMWTYIFATGEHPEAGDAYKLALRELEQRMIDQGVVETSHIEHQTAIRVLPMTGYNPETLEPETRDYPHVLITLHAKVLTPTPTWAGNTMAEDRERRRRDSGWS